VEAQLRQTPPANMADATPKGITRHYLSLGQFKNKHRPKQKPATKVAGQNLLCWEENMTAENS
jgi:hypothetical protein